MAHDVAIQATVTGNDQRVGLRALVMKQAIIYNLVGVARNQPNGVVLFTLQGDAQRIDTALGIIRQGTPRSSNLAITTVSVAVNPDLKTFTIVDWTSSSRDITQPYTLVFTRRDSDTELAPQDAKAVWHAILVRTLDAEDQAKLRLDD